MFGFRARLTFITGGPTIAELVGDYTATTTLGTEIGFGYAHQVLPDVNACNLDLGAPLEVSGLQFLTRSMTDGTAIAETYTVTVVGAETLGPFPASNPADPQTSEVAVTGQEFTFDVETSTGGNTGAVEIRILGG